MTIISRAAWGARHPAGFGPAPLPTTRGVFLHHSVTIAPDLIPPFDDDDHAIRVLEDIGQQRFGGGISYTFAITPTGRIYEGTGVDRQGAHTKGLNSSARAICLVGNYDVAAVPGPILDAVVWLLREGKAQGWWPEARLVGGHRDAPGASTACPGKHAYALIGNINDRAAGAVTIPAPPRPSDQLPILAFGSRHPEVLVLQQFMVRVFRSYNRYTPTGYYGSATKAGITEFQRRVGIHPDGVVGPITRGQLARHGYDS